MEGTLEAARGISFHQRYTGFNPSLHGRYSGRANARAFLVLSKPRFNPSLHGRYSGSSLPNAPRGNAILVSIHLFMEGTLEASTWQIGKYILTVSIHLFMEGTLEAPTGCCRCCGHPNVSIHLFMEGTLEVQAPAANPFGLVTFQSISSWKVLWKRSYSR